jgi:hypothetical protein
MNIYLGFDYHYHLAFGCARGSSEGCNLGWLCGPKTNYNGVSIEECEQHAINTVFFGFAFTSRGYCRMCSETDVENRRSQSSWGSYAWGIYTRQYGNEDN